MQPTVKHQKGFPACVNLRLDFNPHAVDYQSVTEWLAEFEGDDCPFEWVSAAERQRAIDTDSVWVCHWYPDTPVGFRALVASTFETLMVAVNATGSVPRHD